MSNLPDSAEGWFARLHSPECTPWERAQFDQWMAASPEHAAAYDRTDQLHRSMAVLAKDPLVRAAASAARRNGRRQLSRTHWLALATAAALLLTVGGLAYRRQVSTDAGAQIHYANGRGLPLSQRLPDGTGVILDADSAIDIHYDDRGREVWLRYGRAEFTVAASPSRPFEVYASGHVIRDMGTIFMVSERKHELLVGLLEGAVSIARPVKNPAQIEHLSAGQQLLFDPSGQAGPVQPLAAENASWDRGQMMFTQRRLDDLLEEANRYSVTQLKLGDPELAGVPVSGSFHAGDQAALAKALERGWSLTARPTGAHEMTLYRSAPAKR